MSRRIFVPTLNSLFSNRYNNVGNYNHFRDYEPRVSEYRIEEDEKHYRHKRKYTFYFC